jgi:hypothetical protein
VGLFRRNKKKDLVLEGLRGSAVVRAARRDEHLHRVDEHDDPILGDLGIGTLKYRLVLEVHLDDGREPYRAENRYKVPLDVGEIDVGMTFPVYVDPDDPSRVEISWDAYHADSTQTELRDGFDAEEQAVVHDSFPSESRSLMLAGWIQATQMGAMTREQLDEALAGMVQSGVLTQSEADAARARVDEERR